MLGKIYDEGFLPECACSGDRKPLLAEWTAYLLRELSFLLEGYQPINAMIESLNQSNPKPMVTKARELLFAKFLLSEESLPVDVKWFPVASYLASAGALRHVRGNEFQIASALHRLALMTWLGLPKENHYAKLILPLPDEGDDDHRLDVAQVVTEAIKYFYKETIMDAFHSFYKKNKAQGK